MRRSPTAAARWQENFDTALAVAAGGTVVAVGLQTLAKDGPAAVAGAVLMWLVWATFALDAAVMLSVHPEPRRWARGHLFELVVLVVACPLWTVLLHDLLVVELLPVLTVLEAAKLAKLGKAVRVLGRRRTRGEGRGAAAAIVVAAAALAVVMLAR